MAKNETIKNKLYKYMNKNPKMETNAIFQHFVGPLVSKRTLYHWIKQVKETGTLDRKISTGRPIKIATKTNIKTLKKMFKRRSGRSQRAAARKFGCSQQYISNMLKIRTNIKYRKKSKRPF